MKIENLKVYDLAESIVASGYPLRADLSDKDDKTKYLEYMLENENLTEYLMELVNNKELDLNMYSEGTKKAVRDVRRAINLGNAKLGSGHSQWLIGVRVAFDLTFSEKAWTELQRYHFIDFTSSSSCMHCITKFDIKSQCNKYVWNETIEKLEEKCKEYNSLENKDTEEAKELYLEILYNIPSGFQLTARMTTNYSQLKTMYVQRHNHRLPEWREFCEYMKNNLPLFKELTGIDKENIK